MSIFGSFVNILFVNDAELFFTPLPYGALVSVHQLLLTLYMRLSVVIVKHTHMYINTSTIWIHIMHYAHTCTHTYNMDTH